MTDGWGLGLNLLLVSRYQGNKREAILKNVITEKMLLSIGTRNAHLTDDMSYSSRSSLILVVCREIKRTRGAEKEIRDWTALCK